MEREDKICEDINTLLPHQLEKVKKVVDYLLEDKNNNRITNQDYQRNYKSLKCTKCGSDNFKKNGKKNGSQRYFCKNCRRSFSGNKDTVLEYSRITFNQLKTFIKGLLDTNTISDISKEINLSERQTYNLESKIFNALKNTNKEVILKDVVQMDEKYFRISFKGTRKSKMPRKSRKSGSQDLTSGISKDQVCVLIAIDSYDSIEIEIAGVGPVSTEMIEHSFKNKIEPQSILVTDSKNSYIKFAKNNNLILKQIPSGKHSVDGIYNLGELNSLMLEIETYITFEKRGISTRHLQQHLDFLKYRKILKYTFDYLERNSQMYKDVIISFSNLKCRDVCKTNMPIDVSEVYGNNFE